MKLSGRTIQFLITAVTLAVLFTISRPVYADQFSYAAFNFPGAAITQADGINNNADIFGAVSEPFGELIDTRFLFQDGQYFLFPGIVDVNNEGMILLNTSSGPGILFHGQFTPLSVPGSVIAFNDNGTVLVTGGFVKGGVFTPVSYPGATSTTLEDINNLDEVVGSYTSSTGTHAFLYQNGVYTTTDFPGAVQSHATAINNEGEIVGNYRTGVGPTGTQGFIFMDGNFQTFNAFNFITEETETVPTGINDYGVITGYQFESLGGGTRSFVATHVPEPQTLGLASTGLLMLAGAVRRRYLN